MFKQLCFGLLALGSVHAYSMKNVIKIFSRYGTVIFTGNRGANSMARKTIIIKNTAIVSQLERSIKNAKKRQALCAVDLAKKTSKKDFVFEKTKLEKWKKLIEDALSAQKSSPDVY